MKVNVPKQDGIPCVITWSISKLCLPFMNAKFDHHSFCSAHTARLLLLDFSLIHAIPDIRGIEKGIWFIKKINFKITFKLKANKKRYIIILRIICVHVYSYIYNTIMITNSALLHAASQ